MKFARFLEANRREAWAEHYVDYRLLKKRLKEVRLCGYGGDGSAGGGQIVWQCSTAPGAHAPPRAPSGAGAGAPPTPRPRPRRVPQVLAGLERGEEGLDPWPGHASLSVLRGSAASLESLAAAPRGEEAFLVALQQQIAQVGAGAGAGGGGGRGRARGCPGSRQRRPQRRLCTGRGCGARLRASPRARDEPPCAAPRACTASPQVSGFTEREAERLRRALHRLLSDAPRLARAAPGSLKGEARRLGDEVLELERFIQLNQVGARGSGITPGADVAALPLVCCRWPHSPRRPPERLLRIPVPQLTCSSTPMLTLPGRLCQDH
jgi:hypothetical protein